MEHEWGRNVFDYGLGNSGCTLAARLPSPLSTIMVTNERMPVGQARAWGILPDMDAWTPFNIGRVGDPNGHFPYGHPVEPDAPV